MIVEEDRKGISKEENSKLRSKSDKLLTLNVLFDTIVKILFILFRDFKKVNDDRILEIKLGWTFESRRRRRNNETGERL